MHRTRAHHRHNAEPGVGTLPRLAGLLLLALLGVSAAVRGDALERLDAFARQQARTSREVTPARLEAFRELLGDAETLVDAEPARRPELTRVLVAVAGTGVEPPDLVADAALGELERLLVLDRGAAFETWLVDLLDGLSTTDEERRGAVRALGPRRSLRALPGILAAARDERHALRGSALLALVGWSEPPVHAFFLGALSDVHPSLDHLRRHLDAMHGRLDATSQAALSAAMLGLVSQPGWRGAARATRLVPHLDPDRAVPFLIEALGLWVARGADGQGSRRIVHELVGHLRTISGRSLGPSPDAWTTWWKAVRDGRIELAVDASDPAVGGGSTATFFGLEPVSDHVLFVLDRSGSMETPFHPSSDEGGRTRYEEATEQVFRYLTAAGEDTRFGIVLFSDEPSTWRRNLVDASPRNLDAARKWILGKRPKGGTFLHAAVDAAVGVRRNGDLDLESLEADTVVVLCDGGTQEGPAWVRPWLERHNDDAQLVFHAVQIGNSGDGTLQRLAERTGGQFVKVDP